jgi:hypothetical protein
MVANVGGRFVKRLLVVCVLALSSTIAGRHVPLPDTPPDKVQITLERTACFGRCPVYTIDIHGDGRVVYNGAAFVDVDGEHRYRVPPEEVARLIDRLRASDIWSLRSVYRATYITDQSTQILTINMNGQVKRLEDYAGRLVGMPSPVSEFENEVDKVGRSRMWIQFSQETLDQLQSEGYEFGSQASGDILARAVGSKGDKNKDEALLNLLALGAPISGTGYSENSLIEDALLWRREILIDPLIAKGFLSTDGKPDPRKIDAAFRAAIRGGTLALVQKIWGDGDRPRPALTFDDIPKYDKAATPKQSPVTLLLSRYANHKPRDNQAIAKWLASLGCDIKAAGADGATLLHIAAGADDVDFVRYLLEQGIHASTLVD